MMSSNPPEVSQVTSYAAAYARRGWPVFPCYGVHPGPDGALICRCPKGAACGDTGKHPRSTHGVSDATVDLDKINTWFGDGDNIGLATRTMFALDVDLKEGRDGESALAALEQEHGALATPLTESTGGGGRHLFFKQPAVPVRNSNDRLAPGLDVRGDGGYVVVAPSLHATGKRYAWTCDPSAEPADAPAWLLALIAADGKKKKRQQDKTGATQDDEDDGGSVPIREGARNGTLFTFACMLRAKGLSFKELAAALAARNAERCVPPLDDNEIAKIAESAAKYPDGMEPLRSQSGSLVVRLDDPPRVQVARTLEALRASNETMPTLFRRQSVIVRLRRDDEDLRRAWLEELDEKAWHTTLVERVDFNRMTRSGPRPAMPTDALVKVIRGTTDFPLPPISRIVHAPFFTRDGKLVATEGFHANVRVYLALSEDLRALALVADVPTAADVAAARDFIRWPIRQFPYEDDAAYPHSVALMLLPFARQLIDGHTPIHAFTAPTWRTGKGKLINCLCWPGLGRDIPVMPEVGNDTAELRKRLTAIIINGAPLAFFDNIDAVLRGGPLAAVLTATTWSDRILGKSALTELPVEVTWIVAANNLLVSSEIGLRLLLTKLDRKTEDPSSHLFEEPKDCEGYVRAHRAGLVHACLTLIQNWIARGRPDADVPQLGGFESYARVMSGILAAAGIPGFMSNLKDAQFEISHERDTWTSFLERWWKRYRGDALSVNTISTIDDEVFAKRPDEGPHSRDTRFGFIMRGIKGRIFTLENTLSDSRFKVRVTPARYHDGKRERDGGYRLAVVDGDPDAGPREAKEKTAMVNGQRARTRPVKHGPEKKFGA